MLLRVEVGARTKLMRNSSSGFEADTRPLEVSASGAGTQAITDQKQMTPRAISVLRVLRRRRACSGNLCGDKE